MIVIIYKMMHHSKRLLEFPPAANRQLCSQPTMTRLENSVNIRDLIRLFYGQIDFFRYDPPRYCRESVKTSITTIEGFYGKAKTSSLMPTLNGICLSLQI